MQGIQRNRLFKTAFMTFIIFFICSNSGALYAAPMTDAQAVATAQAALSAAAPLKPVEGTDTNIVALAQRIVNQKVSGVTVKMAATFNPQISSTGVITYASAARSNSVRFSLTKNSTTVTQTVLVTIPAKSSVVTPPPATTDAQAVAAAQAALSAAAPLKPVEGTDTNIVTLAQRIVNQKVSGITVKMAATFNPQISSTGVITYASAARSNSVRFSLTKKSTTVTHTVLVTIPAKSSVVTPPPASADAQAVAAAQAALTAAGTFKPVEGKDSNLVTMAQAIVDKSVSGIQISIISSANSNVSSTGSITYGSTANSGNVTLKLSKNSTSASQVVSITVPAKAVVSSSFNVKNYGAKGDGVTDDRTAIQSAINAASTKGGGTVYLPDGKYMVSLSTSGTGLNLASNIKLELSSGAELRAIKTSLTNYRFINMSNVSNVEITGGRIIGDWAARKPATSEYGRGICLYNSTNVRIHDVEISDFIGDGIYVSGNSSGSGGASVKVVIEDFVIHDCCRNGISIISAKDLVIQNGNIYNITGTMPKSFIDVEPNNNTQYAQNIYVKNIKGQNAGGYGYMFGFGHYYNVIKYPCSVTFENCTGTNMALGLYNSANVATYEKTNPALFDLKWL